MTLERLVVVGEELVNHLLKAHVFRRWSFIDSDPGQLRKRFKREILLPPPFQDSATKFFKIGIHRRTFFDQLIVRHKGRESRISIVVASVKFMSLVAEALQAIVEVPFARIGATAAVEKTSI